MNKTVYIENKRNDGTLVNAFSVKLSDKAGTFGIKTINGDILVANETTTTGVTNPSTGLYEYTANFAENVMYIVSWEIILNDGEEASYIRQEIGPFSLNANGIRAVADFRGAFLQNSSAILLLRITDLDGNAKSAESIVISITDPNGSTVSLQNNVPDLVNPGFYAFEWDVATDAVIGEYIVNWTYTVDGVVNVEPQTIIVSNNPNMYSNNNLLYSGPQNALRTSLSHLIRPIQSIPVYREPAKQSKDNKTFEFTFPRWNQSAGAKILRNDNIVTEGITIDYFKGKVIFDNALTDVDRVEAIYNFRYFSDEELDTYLNNAAQMYNITPPTTYGLTSIWVPTIIYGAAIDAIRGFILAMQFPEIALILGNAEAAGRVAGTLESLKKNYEGWWFRALDSKKNGPYVGLTKMVTTPEFALPGGRSRWFRYLFSGGS